MQAVRLREAIVRESGPFPAYPLRLKGGLRTSGAIFAQRHSHMQIIAGEFRRVSMRLYVAGSAMEKRELLKIAKALADETRFRIFKAIVASGEISCGDLASQFPVAQPTVSHHVKVLVDAGLVGARRQGQHSYFCATANALEEFRRCLAMELIAVDSQETTVATARRRQRRAVQWSTPEKPVAVP